MSRNIVSSSDRLVRGRLRASVSVSGIGITSGPSILVLARASGKAPLLAYHPKE
jgi:hypothetical protein